MSRNNHETSLRAEIFRAHPDLWPFLPQLNQPRNVPRNVRGRRFGHSPGHSGHPLCSSEAVSRWARSPWSGTVSVAAVAAGFGVSDDL